jgi:hypothetical protein
MRLAVFLLLVGLLLVGLGGTVAAESAPLLNASALVRVGPDAFLVVSDAKNKGPDVEDKTPHLSILTIEEKGVTHVALPLTGLPHADRPSDLEAACALPGRDDEYLLAESGFYKGKFGRIFQVRVAPGATGWEARLLHTFVPCAAPAPDYSTPDEAQVEGMACVQTGDGGLVLVLARRGKYPHPAKLVWGMLSGLDSRPAFTETGSSDLASNPGALGGRGAADLRLEPAGPDTWRVCSVATVDVGDYGPFRSLIYDAGQLTWNAATGMRFQREPVGILWSLDGLKVEALAGPASRASQSVLSIGTDDEIYGAVWRPLFQRMDF